jgi:hypothetical protein
MEIEDVVGVKFGIENEVDMEEKERGWDLEDIAGDSPIQKDWFDFMSLELMMQCTTGHHLLCTHFNRD